METTEQHIERVCDAKGRLVQLRRYTDEKLQDGPNGEPALEYYYETGQLWQRKRYAAGKLQDAADGAPAWLCFHANGQLAEVHRYRAGRVQDGLNGEPALQGFDDTGRLRCVSHYDAGNLTDRGDDPAVMCFGKDGDVTRAESWGIGRDLSERELVVLNHRRKARPDRPGMNAWQITSSTIVRPAP